MQKKTLRQTLSAKICLLMLGTLLFVSGCGSPSSPGSQPNGTPQATPTKGGYSIITLFENEMQVFLALQRR